MTEREQERWCSNICPAQHHEYGGRQRSAPAIAPPFPVYLSMYCTSRPAGVPNDSVMSAGTGPSRRLSFSVARQPPILQ